MSRLQLAIDQIAFARTYTLRLLDQTKVEDWFRQPPGGITHIAWQVGHLATAEYRLALLRTRGERPEDEQLMSSEFQKAFGAISVPFADPKDYPNQSTIRAVFDRVHKQVLPELAAFTESELDEPALRPHPLFNTKGGVLIWCSQHEFVHAGQIGLLRRQLGYAPVW
jgi:hypothetical protein